MNLQGVRPLQHASVFYELGALTFVLCYPSILLFLVTMDASDENETIVKRKVDVVQRHNMMTSQWYKGVVMKRHICQVG